MNIGDRVDVYWGNMMIQGKIQNLLSNLAKVEIGLPGHEGDFSLTVPEKWLKKVASRHWRVDII
jgi:hypothetical protein